MNKMVRMAVCHPGSHLLITHNQNNFQRESPRYDKALAEFLDTSKSYINYPYYATRAR
jgi:hypothetical protein